MAKVTGGKVTPQDLDAEKSIIGAILLDSDAITSIAQTLKPEHFYKSAHSDIAKAMFQLFEKREPIDLVTLTAQLKKNDKLEDVGGAAYISGIASGVPTSANVSQYAQIIRDHWVKRQLIATSAKLSQAAHDDSNDVRELLDEAEQSVFALSQEQLHQNFLPLKDALAESFDRLDELHKKAGGLRGVPSGFLDLESHLAFWYLR